MNQEKQMNEFLVKGIMNYNHDLNVDQVKCNGILKANGNITAEVIESQGIIKVGGNLSGHEIISKGIIKVVGNINGEQLNSFGLIKANEISCEKAKFKGGVSTKIITCDELEVAFDTNCHIDEIEASKVDVTNYRKKRKTLHANTITADHISLENVTAKKVTGENITIGKRCKVDLVEYSGQLTVHPKSNVKQQVKI